MLDLTPIEATRVVSTSAALTAVQWPAGAAVLRMAPDEALVLAEDLTIDLADPWAIVERDTGWVGVSLPAEDMLRLLAHHAAWTLPDNTSQAQGMAAGLPVKLLRQRDKILLITLHALAEELRNRLR